MATLGNAAGEIIWSPGSRDGVQGEVKKNCRTNTLNDCYIGRFGWLGDRVSLEDQVANAAFVEMNMTTTAGYRRSTATPRWRTRSGTTYPNCGAANKTCVASKGNSDLSELDIQRMADYARWLGNPTRSEIQVSQPEVIAGEKIFNRLQCDTCHVIKRIDIVPGRHDADPRISAHRLTTHVSGHPQPVPVLYRDGPADARHGLPVAGRRFASVSIRDANGVVKPGFESYVQKVRTPPLKGLRFNNYVTDAHRNTKAATPPTPAAISCCTTAAPAMRSRRRSCTMGRRSRSCRSSKG